MKKVSQHPQTKEPGSFQTAWQSSGENFSFQGIARLTGPSCLRRASRAIFQGIQAPEENECWQPGVLESPQRLTTKPVCFASVILNAHKIRL